MLYFYYLILTLVPTSLRTLSAHLGEPIFFKILFFFIFHHEVIEQLTVLTVDRVLFRDQAQQYPVHGIFKDTLCQQHDQYLDGFFARMGTLLAKGRYPTLVRKLTTIVSKLSLRLLIGLELSRQFVIEHNQLKPSCKSLLRLQSNGITSGEFPIGLFAYILFLFKLFSGKIQWLTMPDFIIKSLHERDVIKLNAS